MSRYKCLEHFRQSLGLRYNQSWLYVFREKYKKYHNFLVEKKVPYLKLGSFIQKAPMAQNTAKIIPSAAEPGYALPLQTV